MKKIIFYFIFGMVTSAAYAQNNINSCKGNDISKWNNCFGTEILNHGYQISGYYKDGKNNGLGVHYTNNGSVIFAGTFKNGNWEDPQPLDLKKFPFLPSNNNIGNKQIFDTYMCRRNSEIGYIFKNGKWTVTNFKIENPFFLNINSDRIIDHESFSVLGITSSPEKCTKPYNTTSPEIHQCSGIMSIFSFNDQTLEGAFSMIAGASQSGNRDTVSTGIFKCQKVN